MLNYIATIVLIGPRREIIEAAVGALILFGLFWIAPYLIAIAKVLTEGGAS